MSLLTDKAQVLATLASQIASQQSALDKSHDDFKQAMQEYTALLDKVSSIDTSSPPVDTSSPSGNTIVNSTMQGE